LLESYISYAWNYLMVRRYAEGKLSLEGLARELGKTVSETIDLLAEMGVPSPHCSDCILATASFITRARCGEGWDGPNQTPCHTQSQALVIRHNLHRTFLAGKPYYLVFRIKISPGMAIQLDALHGPSLGNRETFRSLGPP